MTDGQLVWRSARRDCRAVDGTLEGHARRSASRPLASPRSPRRPPPSPIAPRATRRSYPTRCTSGDLREDNRRRQAGLGQRHHIRAGEHFFTLPPSGNAHRTNQGHTHAQASCCPLHRAAFAAALAGAAPVASPRAASAATALTIRRQAQRECSNCALASLTARSANGSTGPIGCEC